MDLQEKKEGKEGLPTKLDSIDKNSSAYFETLVKQKMDEQSLTILLDFQCSRDEMIEELNTFKPKPYGFRRKKGNLPIWTLSFHIADKTAIKEIKKEPTIKIGKLKVRNLHYGLSNGEIVEDVFKYYVDMGNNMFLPTELVKKELKLAGVMVYDVEHETYRGYVTGILSILTGSAHEDGNIKITVEGIKLTLRTVEDRIKRRRAAKQKTKKRQQDLPTPTLPVVNLLSQTGKQTLDVKTQQSIPPKKKKKEKEKEKDATLKAQDVPLTLVPSTQVNNAIEKVAVDKEKPPPKEEPQIKKVTSLNEKKGPDKRQPVRNRKYD